MLYKFKFLVFASFVAAVFANPVFRDLVVHEQRKSVPAGFTRIGDAPGDQQLDLRIALVNSDMKGLENALYAVSTPGSARYGKHLTKEEVEEFVKPSQESVSKVNSFLDSYGIEAKTISPAGDWLSFSVPVSKANEMFGTQFSVYKHNKTGRESVNTLAYSIPSELRGHLDLVHPTITFEDPIANLPVVSSPSGARNITKNANSQSDCDSGVTPACLQQLYNIPATLATETSNTLGVTGLLQQFASEDDLEVFLSNLRPDLPSDTTFLLQTLDGGSNPQDPGDAGLEANLDIQYTVGLASGVPTTFISVGDQNDDGGLGGFLDIVNSLLDESNPPDVLTTSYNANEDNISSALAIQLCNAYMQLGSRGTSILFSSGDGGVAGIRSDSCTTFVPTFPSGCPYITVVGATSGVSEETAAGLSSGGFSNYFGIPPYQKSVVDSYLDALGSTNAGLFDPTGRGFPDVSAQGTGVSIIVNGQTELVDGTSCASPIFASVIALINDRLVATGNSPLGFLNPFLYSEGGLAALNDITNGDNPGCGTTGFPAVQGWDPVTGLGTPNFEKLLSAAMQIAN
ncbi:hypothetical protein M0805_009714 [Coniferiporia weirii]|nr:hypothetical protein M0805_009714 [Coniferiporia weirii]